MRKIIITGAPRTGSTALATILSFSSKILITDELALFDHNPNNYHNQKHDKLTNTYNAKLLKNKGLAKEDIDSFFNRDFANKGGLEFYGDKFPTYCWDQAYCNHLVKNHSDAYFIFTYRDPCATIYSGIKRTRIDKVESADWFFKSFEISIERLVRQTSNWYECIYPYVKNKIIINYDYYINNVNLLINDLETFLNIKLDIQDVESLIGHNEGFDDGKRGLYVHPNPHEYKNELASEEISNIVEKTSYLDDRIKNSIKNQTAINSVFFERLNIKSPYFYVKSLNLNRCEGPLWGGKADIFEKIILQKNPKVIIELGAFLGDSTITMAKALKHHNINCCIITIDTWLGSSEHWLKNKCNLLHLYDNFEFGISTLYNKFITNVLHEGVEDYIVPFPTTTDTAFDVLTELGIKADIIYMDADHREKAVYSDLKNYSKLLSENGVIFGHDIDWCGVKRGVISHCYENNKTYTTEIDSKEGQIKFWIID